MMGRRLCVWVLLSCLLQIDFDSALNPKKFIVNGTVDMVNLDKSFLDLVINFPEEEDEGLYSCLVWFMSKHGTLLPASEEMYLQSRNENRKPHMFKRWIEFKHKKEFAKYFKVQIVPVHKMIILTSTDPSPFGAMYLRDNQTHTEATLQKQLIDVQQKLNNVVTRVKTLESQVFKHELGHKNNSEQIYSLLDKAKNKISFFATFVDKFNVHPNDVLIFDDVKLNDGDCYNSSTGTFLAPVTGLYVFNLFFEVEAPKAIKMQIKLEADNYVISRLFVYAIDDLRGSQASGSVVYRLAAGSQVKASVEYLSMEVKSQARLANGGLSVFSGFLL